MGKKPEQHPLPLVPPSRKVDVILPLIGQLVKNEVPLPSDRRQLIVPRPTTPPERKLDSGYL